MKPNELAKFIDHTLLKPDATHKQLTKLSEEAIQYQFASVCVNPWNVSYCAEILKDYKIPVCTVVGFPLGANTTIIKTSEAVQSIADGATELDMVINIGALKNQDYELVENDIRQIVDVSFGNLVKVIIETCLLTEDEKVTACKISKNAGADFVKTSTGFSTGGATVEDIKLMRKIVSNEMGVKASGGIKNLEDTLAMINAGANRIGASAGVSIVTER
ncbi:MAG: deoxyribose-phosphate aldolase [Candidatus Marinimicrobia bacterium]|nr:deoxyribose-phosphate aldolase [Candidatus Neomarinimicrobiota bacterium]MBL7023675.1 deoxyribose-phosphate aldolase [Candidatus Neomarinimicrobiota bacterium]MBL7109834.1 deoxyribose-phosphate aldolase [Candidatus Neomarinimicrobiota bacterium]